MDGLLGNDLDRIATALERIADALEARNILDFGEAIGEVIVEERDGERPRVIGVHMEGEPTRES